MASPIPEDYIDFLYWFKDQTESKWQEEALREDESKSWLYGGKWVGLDEKHIPQIESKYGVIFSEEHKAFLKILHSVDKKKPEEYYNEQDEIVVEHDPYFFNWLLDESKIQARQKWPFEQILADLKRGHWLKEWGDRPSSHEEIETYFRQWYNQAPKLIPIFGHRCVVSDWQGENGESPVLSIWGTDTIIYGWGIQDYLIHELGEYLDICVPVYDEEYEEWIYEYSPSTKALLAQIRTQIRPIPYWQEILNANS